VEYAEPDTSPTAAAEAIAIWRELAEAEGKASEAQIELLDVSYAAGEVTRATIDEAWGSTLDCYDAAGLTYTLSEEEAVVGSGYSLPGALIDAPLSEAGDRAIDLATECEFQHIIYIGSAYANQPSAVDAQNRAWTSQRMHDCLADRGFAIDDDATADEVRELHSEDILNNGNDPGFDPC
jgi:hypothetical protein